MPIALLTYAELNIVTRFSMRNWTHLEIFHFIQSSNNHENDKLIRESKTYEMKRPKLV